MFLLVRCRPHLRLCPRAAPRQAGARNTRTLRSGGWIPAREGGLYRAGGSAPEVGIARQSRRLSVTLARRPQTNTYTHTHIHTYTHTHIHTYTHTHIHTYTHTSYTHIHIYTYTHTLTYTHIHIYTYTHIHIYTSTPMWLEEAKRP